MSLFFSASAPEFWTTFDQLAATGKPRRAVWTFLTLGLLTAFAVIILGIVIGSELGRVGVVISNTMSLNHNGFLSVPTVLGIILVIVLSAAWTRILFLIRGFALKIGNGTSDPSK